ncbi:MAG: hypothetical protein V4480_00920 [Patescibacteria group bacterium]
MTAIYDNRPLPSLARAMRNFYDYFGVSAFCTRAKIVKKERVNAWFGGWIYNQIHVEISEGQICVINVGRNAYYELREGDMIPVKYRENRHRADKTQVWRL